MARHVADRVAPATDSLVVTCRAEQRERLVAAFEGYANHVQFVEDRTPDAGPVGGMAAGLAAVDTEYALVLASDLPLVDSTLVTCLFDHAAGADAAVPRVDGWVQPTCAVYRTAPTRAACRRALDRDERRTTEVLADLAVRVIDAADESVPRHAFRDVDTPTDYRAVLGYLGEVVA